MTKEIDNIKNVTIYQDFNTATDFYQNLNIISQPTECIIRNISYSGPGDEPVGVFMIWSDLINDFIGSFSIKSTVEEDDVGISICPQTHIHFKQPINSNSQVHFVLYAVSTGNNKAIPVTGLNGTFSMSMDFIQYTK